MQEALTTLAIIVIQSVALLTSILIVLAYLLYADRKVWAAVQLRRGPNVVGPWGLLQSFADLLKFVFKEVVIPAGANKGVFLLAPVVTATLALSAWAVVPIHPGWVVADINVGILYIFAISSLGVYGVIMAGWASNSKYPFLGALRSAAQMVSYEVSIGFVIITVLLVAGSLNLSEIVTSQATGLGTAIGLPGSFLDWYWLPLLPMFVIFFISALAETNRPPFDLPEAESELVAGYMVEYSSTPYLLLMLGEYVAITVMCAFTVILFLGGWLPPLDLPPFNWIPGIVWFVLKLTLVFFMFAMVKAFVPRYRYDQLMRLGWKVFLPISLAWVAITAGVLVAFDLGAVTGWAMELTALSLLGALVMLIVGLAGDALLRRVLYPGLRWRYERMKAYGRRGVEPNLVMTALKAVNLLVLPAIGLLLGDTVLSALL